MIRSLVIILYVGAAWRAASPAQRMQMMVPMEEALEQYKVNGDGSGIKAVIEEALGDPTEWMDSEDLRYIIAIGGGLIGRQAEPGDEEG